MQTTFAVRRKAFKKLYFSKVSNKLTFKLLSNGSTSFSLINSFVHSVLTTSSKTTSSSKYLLSKNFNFPVNSSQYKQNLSPTVNNVQCSCEDVNLIFFVWRYLILMFLFFIPNIFNFIFYLQIFFLILKLKNKSFLY